MKLVYRAQLITAVTMLATSTLQADPTVRNDTISWPDDGWYQVQSSATFESICEGGSSCVVEPGSYIVINHTTGQRFTNITVPTESTPVANAVEVDGRQISWPDDGWYQVQRSDNYVSLCEGSRSCIVEPGTYTVINHTTGMRFPDIRVNNGDSDSDSRPDGTATVEVIGGRISFPDDGWYQVQSATDYASICEGGDSCLVTPGEYIVINHTSGVRQIVSVESPATVPVAGSAINPDNFRLVIGRALDVYSGNIYGGSVFEQPGFRDLESLSAEEQAASEGTYDCTDNGQVVVNYINTTRGAGLAYQFNDCQERTVHDGGFESTDIRFLFGSIQRFQFFVDQVVAVDFRTSDPASSIEFEGSFSRDVGFWSADETSYTLLAPSATGRTISNGNFEWSRGRGSSGSFFINYSGGFTYQAPRFLNGETIDVSADGLSTTLSPSQAFALQGDAGFQDAEAFANVYPAVGTLSIVAADSSRVTLNAATGDESTVSISVTTATGTTEYLDSWSVWQDELRTDTVGWFR